MTELKDLQPLLHLAQTWWNAFLGRLESVEFILHLVVLAGTALVALIVAPFLQRVIRRLLISVVSRDWTAALMAVVASIAIPGLWLLLLWLIVEAAREAGLPVGVAGAGVSLLAAWVVIRLLSHVVRNRFWSRVIFYTAFAIAALNIVGVLGQIETSLAGIGFEYGTIRISALNVVRALIVLGILLWLTALIRSFLERRIVRAESLTPSLQALLVQLLKLLLPTLAVLAALPVLGISLTALTVFGGALAVGIGLGLQKTVSNLVSGLSLIIGGSIVPGDVVAVADVGGKPVYGRVTAIGARYVSLLTRSGIEHLIPNETFLVNGVENWSHTDKKIRLDIVFGIAYDSDVRKAIALALEAAAAAPRVLKSPKPVCLLREFGDSSVNLQLRIWIDDPMSGVANIKSECLLGIWDRLHEHGIGIPFPQRDIHIRSLPDGMRFGPPPERP